MCWPIPISERSFRKAAAPTPGSRTAHEFRLTPWNNDPVQDTTGEAFYIRDEQTGQFWSPTPLPARGATPYVIRHGFGYTVFEHTENGIASELWVYVAMDAPVKFAVLKLRNVSGRRAACPSPATGNGCWATCGRKACCTCRPKWTSRPARCWRAILTTPSSPTASCSSM